MQNGTIKYYDEARGYGLIAPTSGDKDVIFRSEHWAGETTPQAGDSVEYTLIEARRGSETEQVRPAGD